MKYLIAIVAAVQIVAFQNCQNNNFNKSLEGGVLVEKSDVDDEAMTIDEGEGEIPVTGGTLATGGTVSTGGTLGTQGTVGCSRPGNGNGKTPPCSVNPPGGPSVPSEGRPDKDDGSGLYVCVLAGPGHSIKLGYVSNSYVGKVATPDDICMSAKACTDIVSQAFRVKMPARRGFCPNKNPHVHHLSDAQIQTMINTLKK